MADEDIIQCVKHWSMALFCHIYRSVCAGVMLKFTGLGYFKTESRCGFGLLWDILGLVIFSFSCCSDLGHFPTGAAGIIYLEQQNLGLQMRILARNVNNSSQTPRQWSFLKLLCVVHLGYLPFNLWAYTNNHWHSHFFTIGNVYQFILSMRGRLNTDRLCHVSNYTPQTN